MCGEVRSPRRSRPRSAAVSWSTAAPPSTPASGGQRVRSPSGPCSSRWSANATAPTRGVAQREAHPRTGRPPDRHRRDRSSATGRAGRGVVRPLRGGPPAARPHTPLLGAARRRAATRGLTSQRSVLRARGRHLDTVHGWLGGKRRGHASSACAGAVRLAGCRYRLPRHRRAEGGHDVVGLEPPVSSRALRDTPAGAPLLRRALRRRHRGVQPELRHDRGSHQGGDHSGVQRPLRGAGALRPRRDARGASPVRHAQPDRAAPGRRR